jgi:hypothetical protein
MQNAEKSTNLPSARSAKLRIEPPMSKKMKPVRKQVQVKDVLSSGIETTDTSTNFEENSFHSCGTEVAIRAQVSAMKESTQDGKYPLMAAQIEE